MRERSEQESQHIQLSARRQEDKQRKLMDRIKQIKEMEEKRKLQKLDAIQQLSDIKKRKPLYIKLEQRYND